MTGWKKFYDERPPNERGQYRFRVSERVMLGLSMRPEWTADMHYCGMGYSESEWWPQGSHWDGYRRTVDPTLEWRVLTVEDSTTEVIWHGLDLLPSPFTGLYPDVRYGTRYIGAPLYHAEWIGIESWMVSSSGYRSAETMRNNWNRRAESPLLEMRPGVTRKKGAA